MTTNGIDRVETNRVERQPLGWDAVHRVRERTNAIALLMRDVLIDKVHYGQIDGCGPKPALLLPGAQKIASMFQLSAESDETLVEMPNEHREYRIKVRLIDRATGHSVAEGVGVCTTMEKKYRYRKVNNKRIENECIADVYNTVYKMAHKRAMVHAVLQATAASDIFAQDIDESPDMYQEPGGYQEPRSRSAAKPNANGVNSNGDSERPAQPTDAISQKQRGWIFARLRELNIDRNHFKQYLLDEHGIDSTNNITRAMMPAVEAWMNDYAESMGGAADVIGSDADA